MHIAKRIKFKKVYLRINLIFLLINHDNCELKNQTDINISKNFDNYRIFIIIEYYI